MPVCHVQWASGVGCVGSLLNDLAVHFVAKLGDIKARLNDVLDQVNGVSWVTVAGLSALAWLHDGQQ